MFIDFATFFFEVPLTVCMYKPWGLSRTTVACVCDVQSVLQFWEWRKRFSHVLQNVGNLVFVFAVVIVILEVVEQVIVVVVIPFAAKIPLSFL
jgi:hypothetical protein